MNTLLESLLQFAITLREGVEISLILAIVFAFLARTDRRSQFSAVWIGVGVASGICVAAAVTVFSLFGKLSGVAAATVEGIVMLVATGVITWMIFWMRSHARAIKGELHGGLALASSSFAVALFAATAVLREGFETVMILLSSGAASSAPLVTMGASALGFAGAGVIGVSIYRRGSRLDLQKFFRVTGVALIAFATYSFIYGLHELSEYYGIALLIVGAAGGAAYFVGMTRWFLRAPAPRAQAAPTPAAPTAGDLTATNTASAASAKSPVSV